MIIYEYSPSILFGEEFGGKVKPLAVRMWKITNYMYIGVSLIAPSWTTWWSNLSLGTCKYIGPIEEKIISEEIFVGIELDECITKNSGVFGSRQVNNKNNRVNNNNYKISISTVLMDMA